mmetsp:Transcript_17134/g.43923  ORF Transcript_17134/g.43923 Transcript_17134/m.43923 type:complete len:415 (+) Transcript_17134:474-1718(+)
MPAPQHALLVVRHVPQPMSARCLIHHLYVRFTHGRRHALPRLAVRRGLQVSRHREARAAWVVGMARVGAGVDRRSCRRVPAAGLAERARERRRGLLRWAALPQRTRLRGLQRAGAEEREAAEGRRPVRLGRLLLLLRARRTRGRGERQLHPAGSRRRVGVPVAGVVRLRVVLRGGRQLLARRVASGQRAALTLQQVLAHAPLQQRVGQRVDRQVHQRVHRRHARGYSFAPLQRANLIRHQSVVYHGEDDDGQARAVAESDRCDHALLEIESGARHQDAEHAEESAAGHVDKGQHGHEPGRLDQLKRRRVEHAHEEERGDQQVHRDGRERLRTMVVDHSPTPQPQPAHDKHSSLPESSEHPEEDGPHPLRGLLARDVEVLVGRQVVDVHIARRRAGRRRARAALPRVGATQRTRE